jgi:hypothetical protein
LALGLQAQRGNNVAQFDEPVVFLRLLRAVNGFDGLIFTIDDGLAAWVIVVFSPGSLSG